MNTDYSKQLEISFKKVKIIYKEHVDELVYLLDWTWPVLISNILNNVVYMFINMAFIGRIGTKELAAVALGNTWSFCTSSIALGSLNAMDTFISQAYGANNNKLIGLTVQRATIVTFALSLIITIFWCITKPVLILIHQDAEVAGLAAEYVFGLLPGLYFGNLLTILEKYLQGMGIMKPSILVGIILNIFNAIFNFILVHGVTENGGIGVIGASLSTSISRLASLVMIYFWIKYFNLHKDTWFGFSMEALEMKGIKEYCSLGIPAGLQLSFEGWGFEILTLLSGYFGSAQLDAHSITMNFTFLTFMVPLSISIALSVRIGQLLGSKDKELAKKSTRVSYTVCLLFMSVIAIFQYTTRHHIGKFYTSDPEVQYIVAHIIPIAALFQLFDGFQCTSQGVIRGTGKNKIGAVVNFVAFYCIGIPLGCILGFGFHKQVYGFWFGIAGGLFCNALILGCIVYRIDWDKEVDNAIERTSTDFVKIDDEQTDHSNVTSTYDDFEKFNSEEVPNSLNELLLRNNKEIDDIDDSDNDGIEMKESSKIITENDQIININQEDNSDNTTENNAIIVN